MKERLHGACERLRLINPREVARAVQAEVVAVYAFEPLVEWVPESDPRSWREAAERQLEDEWLAPLRDAGVSVRTRVITDIHPVAALAGVVEREGAGLAVVGTRGIGLSGLRLRRVPIQLVHHTQLPVVLVPPPPGRAPPREQEREADNPVSSELRHRSRGLR